MTTHRFGTGGLLVALALVAASVRAQVPSGVAPSEPAPPRTLPPSVTGAGANPSAPLTAVTASGTMSVPSRVAAPESLIERFDPIGAFPVPTQQAVKSLVQGAEWLAGMNLPQGRFQYGQHPAVRVPMEGDDDLRQAHAAHALAASARFTGNVRQTAVAGQAVLSLLAATNVDPADTTCRVPAGVSAACNKVGFAAALALAVYALPGADDRLVAEADRLCEYLHKRAKADGSVAVADGTVAADRATETEWAGLALHAIAVSHRVRPAAWKNDALSKGLGFYRAAFLANPHPLAAATLTPAFAEWYVQSRTPAAAAFVFEMNDWLAGLQYPATDARHAARAGGFKAVIDGRLVDAPPGVECGRYVQSLAWACHLTRQVPDLARFVRYRQATLDGLQFLSGLQYTEANTRHFENGYRATALIGGFYAAPTDGDLRIEATAHALTALLRYLQSGAEKE